MHICIHLPPFIFVWTLGDAAGLGDTFLVVGDRAIQMIISDTYV